jgi:hypothetical protein
VGFVIRELRNKALLEVKESLSRLPTGLGGLCERMLLQIRQERRDIAALILRWVTVEIASLISWVWENINSTSGHWVG